MKVYPIYLLLLALSMIACSEGVTQKSEDSEKKEQHSERKATGVEAAIEVDSLLAKQAIKDSLELKRLTDSVEIGDRILLNLQTEFLQHLKNRDFTSVQEMLYSEGIFYFTVGRIAKSQFDLKGIKKSKGKLDGAYSYGENIPEKIVSGDYWLDSITAKLKDSSSVVYSDYGAVGFGFTGNYCSDHIDLDAMFNGESGSGVLNTPQYRVIYSYYDKIDWATEYLMLEFILENNEWKVYAIGNLEWTP